MTDSDLDARLDTLRAREERFAGALDGFRRHLLDAPDEALFRMSPLRYAAARGMAEQDAIDLFLHATHAGILEFAWGVLCPGCLAFLTTPGGLRSLHRGKRCNFCSIDIEASIDDRVEVAFTVTPTVRRIRFHAPDALDLGQDALRLYFSSSISAASVPHRRLSEQILLAGRAQPGAAYDATVTLPEGANALLVPSSHTVVFLHARPDAAPRAAALEVFDGRAIPDDLTVAAGPFALSIHNRTRQPLGFVLVPAGTEWPMPALPGCPFNLPVDPYLSGARLIASQAFRDLFRADSIPSEGGLALKSVTVLFTDLKGSTSLYERVGDIRAYDVVRRHFSILRAVVAAHGGAVVKTMGDAVMASFADPLAATRAAVAMRREIARVDEGELVLKIGLHTGSAIAVEDNDRLDYFGRTVNIAARVQGIAGAGEIVCTEVAYAAPGVREAVAAAGLSAQPARVPLRGIHGEVPVVRLAPPADDH
jgi:class 3 adenylate cyclase